MGRRRCCTHAGHGLPANLASMRGEATRSVGEGRLAVLGPGGNASRVDVAVMSAKRRFWERFCSSMVHSLAVVYEATKEGAS